MKYLMLALLVLMSACATPYDVEINESFDDVIEDHQVQQSAQVASKATAIQQMFSSLNCVEDTAACGAINALAAALGSREIREIKAQAFTQERSVTGASVQKATVEAIGDGIEVLTLGFVSYKAIDKDKGSVSNRTGDGGTIENVLDEDHTTAVGDGTTAHSQPDDSTNTELGGEE